MNNASMPTVLWVNGALRDPQDGHVSALDHGFTVGDGIFETLEVRAGVPFALTRHLERLDTSASRMGLAPVDRDVLRAGIDAVLGAGGTALTRLRITVASGAGPLGSARGDGPATVAIVATAAPGIDRCHAWRVPWSRNENSPLTGVKSTSYAENALMVEYARARGGDEALMANTRGDLCEGTGSNVVIERGGEVLTPPLDSGCLAGITRALAFEWGADAGLPVREAAAGELAYQVLDEVIAGEAFAAVTSSTRHVQPLSSLDGVPLTVGPLLGALAAQFDRRAALEVDPIPGQTR